MLKEMMHPICKGQSVEINLSKWGYKGYVAECSYYFDKKKDKYSISMWLKNTDVGDRMKLSSKKVDTQYISGTRDTILENICRIVHHCATVADKKNNKKYFDPFVERYEYECKCFDIGNEILERKRLNQVNDTEK